MVTRSVVGVGAVVDERSTSTYPHRRRRTSGIRRREASSPALSGDARDRLPSVPPERVSGIDRDATYRRFSSERRPPRSAGTDRGGLAKKSAPVATSARCPPPDATATASRFVAPGSATSSNHPAVWSGNVLHDGPSTETEMCRVNSFERLEFSVPAFRVPDREVSCRIGALRPEVRFVRSSMGSARVRTRNRRCFT